MIVHLIIIPQTLYSCIINDVLQMNFVAWASKQLDSLDENHSIITSYPLITHNNNKNQNHTQHYNEQVHHNHQPISGNKVEINSSANQYSVQKDRTNDTIQLNSDAIDTPDSNIIEHNPSPTPTVTVDNTLSNVTVLPATHSTYTQSLNNSNNQHFIDNSSKYRIHDLETENASLRSVWDETRNKLNKATNLLLSTDEQHQSSIKQLELQYHEQCQLQRAEYETQLRELNNTIKQLHIDNESLCLHKQQTTHTHSVEYEQLLTQYNELINKNSKLQHDLSTSQQAYNHIQNNQQSLTQQHTELLESLKSEQLQHEQLLEQQIQQQQLTITRLQLQSTDVNNGDHIHSQYIHTIESLKQQLHDLSRQNERICNEKQYVLDDLCVVQRQLDQSHYDNKQLDQQLSNMHIQHAESITALNVELDTLKQQLQLAQSQHILLQQQIQSNHHTVNDNQQINELTDRLKSMSDNVFNKSQLIDELISEKSTLTVRYENLSNKYKQLEQRNNQLREQLQSVPYNTIQSDHDEDLEANVILLPSTKQRNKLLGTASKHRSHRTMNVSNNHTIDRVLSRLDTFIYQSIGIIIQKYQRARIIFILYLLLLHLWCIVILFHFVHHESIGSDTVLPDSENINDMVKSDLTIHN